ncbi:hypothetical protein [Paraburkholderia silvatlantica]|uniref:hypothetical protein n=1 Tax=Paraburkholderia silvatlantica TaxID=321895 RepID=UPI003752B958
MSSVGLDMLDELLETATEIGNVAGHGCAYRDVQKQIEEAIAKAEDELTRNPKSDLVMGEIMALHRLAARIAPAPATYERKAQEYSERLETFLAGLRESVEARQQSSA